MLDSGAPTQDTTVRITFRGFLKEFKGEDSPFGDLAGDFFDDARQSGFLGRTSSAVKDHLRSQGVPGYVRDTFDEVLALWKTDPRNLDDRAETTFAEDAGVTEQDQDEEDRDYDRAWLLHSILVPLALWTGNKGINVSMDSFGVTIMGAGGDVMVRYCYEKGRLVVESTATPTSDTERFFAQDGEPLALVGGQRDMGLNAAFRALVAMREKVGSRS